MTAPAGGLLRFYLRVLEDEAIEVAADKQPRRYGPLGEWLLLLSSGHSWSLVTDTGEACARCGAVRTAPEWAGPMDTPPPAVCQARSHQDETLATVGHLATWVYGAGATVVCGKTPDESSVTLQGVGAVAESIERSAEGLEIWAFLRGFEAGRKSGADEAGEAAAQGQLAAMRAAAARQHSDGAVNRAEFWRQRFASLAGLPTTTTWEELRDLVEGLRATASLLERWRDAPPAGGAS